MKRLIHAKVSIQQDVLLEDSIVIDIDVEVPAELFATTSSTPDRFPGKDQFRQDVVYVLEGEYGFEVIEDTYDGKRQKGHVSNRKDSVSLYFDTYYDFLTAHDVFERLGIQDTSKIPQVGKVHCFIHLRISDHMLIDDGDIDHISYLNDNAKKYTADPRVTHQIREEVISLNESTLERCYSDALDRLRDDIDVRIASWVRTIDRLKRVSH